MAERIKPMAAPAEQSKELRRALGLWLKQGREEKGLTQADLAHQLGLRYYSFISQVENGIGRIPQDLYAPWAQALDIDQAAFAMTVLEHVEPGLHAMIAEGQGASGSARGRKAAARRG